MTSLFGLVCKSVAEAGFVVTGVAAVFVLLAMFVTTLETAGNSALILASKLKDVSCPAEGLTSTFESKTCAAFCMGLELA